MYNMGGVRALYRSMSSCPRADDHRDYNQRPVVDLSQAKKRKKRIIKIKKIKTKQD